MDHITPFPPTVDMISPGQTNHVEVPDVDPEPIPDTKHSNNTGAEDMTVITTISITAVCITAILVISALLILKLRKPGLMMPIKLEEASTKPCTENCTSTLLRLQQPQQLPPNQQNFPFTDV